MPVGWLRLRRITDEKTDQFFGIVGMVMGDERIRDGLSRFWIRHGKFNFHIGLVFRWKIFARADEELGAFGNAIGSVAKIVAISLDD